MDHLQPDVQLEPGERQLAVFQADPATYLRANAGLAAVAMAAGMGVLWLIGDPNVWAGAVGGLAAIGIRAAYLRSDELAVRWVLTNRRLMGPQLRKMTVDQITTVRSLGSMVQVITGTGDKHLIKYQANPAATKAEIERAR